MYLNKKNVNLSLFEFRFFKIIPVDNPRARNIHDNVIGIDVVPCWTLGQDHSGVVIWTNIPVPVLAHVFCDMTNRHSQGRVPPV